VTDEEEKDPKQAKTKALKVKDFANVSYKFEQRMRLKSLQVQTPGVKRRREIDDVEMCGRSAK